VNVSFYVLLTIFVWADLATQYNYHQCQNFNRNFVLMVHENICNIFKTGLFFLYSVLLII
jgi:hypothetical protein